MGGKAELAGWAKNTPGLQQEKSPGSRKNCFRINYKIDPDSPFAKSFASGEKTFFSTSGAASRRTPIIPMLRREVKNSVQIELPGMDDFAIQALGQKPEGRGILGTLGSKAGFAFMSLAILQFPILASNLIYSALNSAKGYKQENARTLDISKTMVNAMPPKFEQPKTEEKTKNQILQENMKKIGEGLAGLNTGLQKNDPIAVEKARRMLNPALGSMEKVLDANNPLDKTLLLYIGALNTVFGEQSAFQQYKDTKGDLSKFYFEGQVSFGKTPMTVGQLFVTLSKINTKLLENINGLVAKELAEKNITEGRHDKTSTENILKDVPNKTKKQSDDILQGIQNKGMELPQQQKKNTTENQDGLQKQQIQQVQKTVQELTNIGTSQVSDREIFHSQWLLYRRDFKVTEEDRKAADKGVKEAIAGLLGTYGYGLAQATEIANFTRENKSFTQAQFEAKFGAGAYNELQAMLKNAAQNINSNGMTVYGFASMEVLEGAGNFAAQKKNNIQLGGDRAKLGKEAMVALFGQFGIAVEDKKIVLNNKDSLKFIKTDVNEMCRYLEGGAYVHPVTGETLRLATEDEKKAAKMHLDYMLQNRIVSKDWNGNYVAPDIGKFSSYVTNSARGKLLDGVDNPFMVMNRGVSLQFGTDVRLRISTIPEQSGKPNEPMQIPGKVDMLLPGIKDAFDRTGAQWGEKVPVTAEVYLGDKKVADAKFNRETGMFEVPGLKTGDYELRASAMMGDLTASVIVPIKISGLVSPAQISSVDSESRTVTFKASIQSDANAQISANGFIYYSFGTFEKEGGKWMTNIYDKDAKLLGKADVLDKQGKPVTGSMEEDLVISYNGTNIGTSILKGRDMLPSFSIDEESGSTLRFMEDSGLVGRVPIKNGTCTIKTEDEGNVFPKAPSVSSAFVPETVKLR